MPWAIRFHAAFDPEFQALPQDAQDELLAQALVLAQLGPSLGRPYVDTLKGSNFPNMKELRFNTKDGVWRVAFAFDPERCAILLVAGDKGGLWGKSEKQFYKSLTAKADTRYTAHLGSLAKTKKGRE